MEDSKWWSWSNSRLPRSGEDWCIARVVAIVRLLREAAAKSFLPVQVGHDRTTERAARDVWGFKEWFPVAHHSSAPVKASSRRFIGCVYTGSGWIFFGENFAGVSVSVGEERSSYRSQITHLSNRVKTKNRVTDASRRPSKKRSFRKGSRHACGVGKLPLRHWTPDFLNSVYLNRDVPPEIFIFSIKICPNPNSNLNSTINVKF